MKKKVSFIITLWWVLLLGALGAYCLFMAPKGEVPSKEENRMLRAFPEFSWTALADGSYGNQIEEFLSDKLLLRAPLINLSDRFFGLLSLAGEQDAPELDMGAVGTQETEPTEATEQTVPTLPQEGGQTLEETHTKPDYADTGYVSDPAVWAGNRYTERFPWEDPGQIGVYLSMGVGESELFSVSRYAVESSAQALTQAARLLGEGGRLYAVPVYNSKTMNEAGRMLRKNAALSVHSQIEPYLRSLLPDNVSLYSLPEILGPHLAGEEPVYFTTDHHWTPYGASLVADTVILDMGYPTGGYGDFPSKTYPGGFYGSYSVQNNTGKHEDITVTQELKPTQLFYIGWNSTLREVEYIRRGVPAYNAYLGAMVDTWAVIRTGSNTGRKALMCGDSYLLTFAVSFNELYDEIYIVDHRYYDRSYGGSMAQILERCGIDDVFVVYLADYFYGPVLQQKLPAMLE